MSDDTPNSEGVSPADDVDTQIENSTMAENHMSETGGDADDLAKADHDGTRTEDDHVAEGRWKSTTDGSGTSETD